MGSWNWKWTDQITRDGELSPAMKPKLLDKTIQLTKTQASFRSDHISYVNYDIILDLSSTTDNTYTGKIEINFMLDTVVGLWLDAQLDSI